MIQKKGDAPILTHPRVYCREPVIAASACASFSGEPMSNQRRRNRIHYYVVPFKKNKKCEKVGLQLAYLPIVRYICIDLLIMESGGNT